MPDFDEQWQKLMGKENFSVNDNYLECDPKRVKDFLNYTGIKPWHKKDSWIKGKVCLDAGCGPGRWTYAMQKLGALRVDSFDISPEAVKLCKKTNPDAYIFDLFELKQNPNYYFVLSWGVLSNTKDTREAFSKVASQVKKGGMLHIMVYDKKYDSDYDGYRGNTCVEKHKEWEKLSFEEKIKMCNDKVKTVGGDIHGWFDAFNPKYNWSFEPNEVKKWFEEEGFIQIKLRKKTYLNSIPTSQINMNGILK